MTEMFLKLFVESSDVNSKLPRKVSGSFLGKLLQQRLQFGVGRRESDAWLQFYQRTVVNVRVVADLERQIYGSVFSGEPRWQDSDDRVVLVHKLNSAPYHARVRIEVPLPKQIAQNHHRLRVLTIRSIGRDESGSQQRGYPEMNPSICCELGGRDILGKILVRRGEIPRPPACGNTFEAFELPKRLKLWTSDPDPAPVTALRQDSDVDHPVGALIRIGVRQQAIHNTENGRRRTNAQCQGSDGSEGEPRLLAQFAPGISKILQHYLILAAFQKVTCIATVGRGPP